jgi:isocitrate dehydrogenase
MRYSVIFSRIFAAADVPILWDPVDVTPVRYPDGTMGIPKAVIESVNKHKVGLKSPLMTPVGKGFRSLNLALRKGDILGPFALPEIVALSSVQMPATAKVARAGGTWKYVLDLFP